MLMVINLARLSIIMPTRALTPSI